MKNILETAWAAIIIFAFFSSGSTIKIVILAVFFLQWYANVREARANRPSSRPA